MMHNFRCYACPARFTAPFAWMCKRLLKRHEQKAGHVW
jgi:hypothetical protein